MKGDFPRGTIRIKKRGFMPVIRRNNKWIKHNFDTTNILKVVEIYSKHNKFNLLIDNNDSKFLKGFLLPGNKVRGERINILPNGKKLNKAFSLFSPNLTFHDQKNNSHWDVIYQNPNGDFSYLYTLDKIKKFQKQKYQLVEEFSEVLPKLKKNISIALKKNDFMALPMLTLLKTNIRVGNEIYYRENGHKGLTTLKKKNVSIDKNYVKFNFIGKDGVPQEISEKFPNNFITQFSNHLNKLKKDNFIFTDDKNQLLKENNFEDAFERYCGKKFYPHIVRSYYATKSVENYLMKNSSPSKKEIVELYNQIAEKLGHKKFSKKDNTWKTSHSVTIAHYVSPDLVEKVNKIVNSTHIK